MHTFSAAGFSGVYKQDIGFSEPHEMHLCKSKGFKSTLKVLNDYALWLDCQDQLANFFPCSWASFVRRQLC